MPVRLVVDGKTLDQRLLDLPKKSTTDVAFDVSFDQPGYREGTITLASDGLPVDDVFYFSVPVRKALRVLLIDGDPRTTLVASETFYLMNALNPEPGLSAGTNPATGGSGRGSGAAAAGEFDVVILANVRNLSSNLRARLMDFANQGGGLWWFLGHQVDPAVYNRTLFDTPTRLLPARLGALLDRPEVHPVVLQSLDASHPVLRPIASADRTPWRGCACDACSPRRPPRIAPTTRVLLALPDGRPLLLEGAAGQGRVLLFTSTGDVDWNEVAVTTGYCP